MVARLLYFAKLSLTVIGISFVMHSAHGDKSQDNVSHNETNYQEGALATNEHHSCEQYQQKSGNGKSVR